MMNKLSTPTAKTRKGTTSMMMSVTVTLTRLRKQMEPTTANSTIRTPIKPIDSFRSTYTERGGQERESLSVVLR